MRGHGELLYILILVNIKSVENLHFFIPFMGLKNRLLFIFAGVSMIICSFVNL